MIFNRGYKFQLKPSESELLSCLQFAGGARWIFNWGLEQRKKVYEATGKTLSYFEQNNELTLLKKMEETVWLQTIHSQVLQQSLKDLNRAYKNFFRRLKNGEKPGFPKFKKKGVKDRFRFPQGVKVEGDQVYLPCIGWIQFRKSRELKGVIKETTISIEGGKLYVSFSCEWEEETPLMAPIDSNRAVGIDVGLTRFATLAIGDENKREDIQNPRFLQKGLDHIAFLSRQLSKKVDGSKNRAKAKKKLFKHHQSVKNQRHNFVHQLTAEMIKNHDIFCVETLDIANLLEKSPKGLARSLSDVGWGLFFHCLHYKAKANGKHVVEVGKYFPSSQICSSCNNQQEMPLSVREYHCISCKKKHDRDYNSAIVIKAAGISVLKACGAALKRGSYEAGIFRL